MEREKLKVFDTKKELFEHAASIWIEEFTEAILHRGIFSAGLSGGSTPKGYYELLTTAIPDYFWSKTALFQVDERIVPESHESSNFNMILSTLLNKVSVDWDKVFEMPYDSPLPEVWTKHYNDLLDSVPLLSRGENNLPLFDLLILGTGTDGHTASLFPETGAALVEDSWALSVSPAHAPHERLSLTMPVLQAARCKLFLITGSSKADILLKLLTSPKDYPAGRVMSEAEGVIVLADKEAAAKI